MMFLFIFDLINEVGLWFEALFSVLVECRRHIPAVLVGVLIGLSVRETPQPA